MSVIPNVVDINENYLNSNSILFFMETEIQQIKDKLSHIQSDIDYLKEHISDVDLILTDDDEKALREAEEDLAKGRTKRL
jgi:hypothetical protein